MDLESTQAKETAFLKIEVVPSYEDANLWFIAAVNKAKKLSWIDKGPVEGKIEPEFTCYEIPQGKALQENLKVQDAKFTDYHYLETDNFLHGGKTQYRISWFKRENEVQQVFVEVFRTNTKNHRFEINVNDDPTQSDIKVFYRDPENSSRLINTSLEEDHRQLLLSIVDKKM
jgi:hypothetical protein